MTRSGAGGPGLADRPSAMSPGWMSSAACADSDAGLFFPKRTPPAGGGSPYAAAKQICDTCQVADRCLAMAMTAEEGDGPFRYGMYGGKTPRQRHDLAKPANGRRAQPAAVRRDAEKVLDLLRRSPRPLRVTDVAHALWGQGDGDAKRAERRLRDLADAGMANSAPAPGGGRGHVYSARRGSGT